MATGTLTRKERIALRRKQEQRKQIIAVAAILAGILLLAAAGGFIRNTLASGSVEIEYSPEDIVYDQPLHAVHEMGPGPAIPFLPKDGPQPEIVISERFHDFGKIEPSEVVTKEFVISNNGQAPLTISRAYTTCGCTTGDFTSATIPPGKVVIMTLTLDAGFHDVRGQTVRRGVIIENNDPGNSNAEIWTEASVLNTP